MTADAGGPANRSGPTLAEQADDDTCTYCGKLYTAHCQTCWHCPGTHDEMCGW